MIWRRLLVRSDSTIADLHHTLQLAMGWEDVHLHQFIIRGKRYGISWLGSIDTKRKQAEIARLVGQNLFDISNDRLGTDRFNFDTRTFGWVMGILALLQGHDHSRLMEN